jgi:aspartate aminotransferase-like enzyme
VLAAMSQPIIHHRTPQFSALFAETAESLKGVFQTQQDVLILAASGTGGMEGAVTNLLSPGDEVIVVNGGKFGERWLKLCAAYGVRVHEVKVEWGEAVEPAAVEECLRAHPGVRAVLMQASETSTTALHPVEAIARVLQRGDALLVVDGITAVGVLDLPMDRWGVDVLVTGSQKALMLPPGLAFVALSERAWARTKSARLPRFYFDFARERESLRKRTTAWTPAISLIVGLREALRLIDAEGLPAVFARHARLAAATRAGAEGLGLRLLAPRAPSPAATGIRVPEGVDGVRLVRFLRDTMGVTMAGGQDHLTGKILRIAHLGYVGAFDVVVGLAALEMALTQLGHPVPLGQGVGAAQAVLKDEWREPRAG